MPDETMPDPTVPNAQFLVGGRKYIRLADDWWEEYENAGVHRARVSGREAQLLDRLLIVVERDAADATSAEPRYRDPVFTTLAPTLSELGQRLDALLNDEDLDDEKLQAASEGLLGQIGDAIAHRGRWRPTACAHGTNPRERCTICPPLAPLTGGRGELIASIFFADDGKTRIELAPHVAARLAARPSEETR